MTSIAQDNIARVRKGMGEVWNNGKWELAVESYHDDIVVHTPTHPHPLHGRDEFKEMWSDLHTGYPDFHIDIHDIFADGDKVAVRFTMTGTNTGPLSGMPATGKPVTIKELGLFRFRGERIEEIWFMTDSMAIGKQLGFIPDGPPPPKMVIVLMNTMSKVANAMPKRGKKR